MAYSQDRKYDHWLKVSPKNIEEKNTNHGEASPPAETADWGKIEKEQRGENESMYRPWEKGDEGHTYGTEQKGEEARKPHSGGEPGKKGK